MVLMECVDEKFTSIIDQVETKGYLKNNAIYLCKIECNFKINFKKCCFMLFVRDLCFVFLPEDVFEAFYL